LLKRALITGITGQDGAYLARSLLEKGYEVYGAYRRTTGRAFWRLEELGILDRVKLVPMDLLELTNIMRVIEAIKPHEVYNLAAQSFVGLSFEQPILTVDINALGPLRILETLRTIHPTAKFYQASSSEMFGKVSTPMQREETPFHPRSAYAASKAFAHWITVNYRESYNMFTVSGILFNHESPLRGEEFVTRRISKGVAEIKLGIRDKLILGNLEAKRDWGYAPEYVEAIYLMMQQEKPDDYVIATGENHSVREFVEKAFECVGMELCWEGQGERREGHREVFWEGCCGSQP
jgi:GDPmannose 4,6-dehydratase